MSAMQLHDNLILSKRDLIQGFELGCKNKTDFKYGIEYERLLINKNNFQAIPYYGEMGIHRLLRQIAFKDEWSYITDFGQVVGLKKGNNTITLEPGGQLEISLAPQKTIQNLEKEIQKLDKKIKPIAENLNIDLINYGISPLSTHKEISLIPKKRYEIMARELPGELHSSMMRESAGIQVTFDYESEEDAMKKLKLSLMLSPVMTAMFANSPIYEGKMSGYKSYRALSWLHTDNNRCGLINKKIFSKECEFSFSDYIDVLLDIPVMFIIRGGKIVEINQKITFKTFIREGYEEYIASIDDFNLHANIFFPETRINSYLESRNHDSQKGALKYSIPAIYKGIFYNNNSINEALHLFKGLKYEDFMIAREEVPRCAMQYKLGTHKIADLAKEIMKIAHYNLNKEGSNENKYLEPIAELVEQELCPADIIIKNWHNKWSGDFKKFIQHIKE